jgi:hypothetical protein
MAAYRAAMTPEQLERDRASKRAYQERNREKMRERGREWAKMNPEKVKECNRTWRENNPEKRALYHAKWIVGTAVGVASKDAPLDLAEAKASQLLVVREIKRRA